MSVLVIMASDALYSLFAQAENNGKNGLSGVVAQVDFSQTATLASYRFLLSKDVTPHVRYMDNPDRIIIDWPQVSFQLTAANEATLSRPKTTDKAEGLIISNRFGLVSSGRSRAVIEVRGPARITRLESELHTSGLATSFVMEIAQTDRDVFSKLMRESTPPPSLSSDVVLRRTTPSNDPRPLIMLDPGHGGIDSGAIASGGVMEKTIVFDFARTLKTQLEASGKYRVMMTRESDVFIALNERVKIARDNQAALFVSIHADSLSSTGAVRGATVYTRADRASDAESEQLAANENRADVLAGVEAIPEAEEVGDILTDLTRRETHIFSQKAARLFVEGLSDSLRLNKNPHRSARFVVLKAHDVPSVLIELGYLSSKDDVALLQSQVWREKAATGLKRVIETYLTQLPTTPKP